MMDFVQIQNDLYFGLLTYEPLASVNVKQFRKMVIESEVDAKLIYLSTRNGRTGAGCLVEMPLINVNLPNVEGPIYNVTLPVLVIEQPTINMQPTSGTLLSAEEIAGHVLDVFHLLQVDGVGQLRAASNAIQPSTEYRGVVAYRVNLSLMNPRGQTQRSGYVTITIAGGYCTLTCVTPDAQIYYTLDGSFPTKFGNSISRLYDSPFPVQSGDVIRAASYAAGFNVSAIKQATAP